MKNFIIACLFLLNIISILGMEASLKEECNLVNTFFDNYIKESGSDIEINDCCEDDNICENGHIVQYKFSSPESNESIDFSEFPILPNLKTLVIEGHVLKDGKIPERLFEIPSLEYLNVTHADASLTYIPDDCSLISLDLYKNGISGFPYEVTNCKNLKLLNLSHNDIRIIPSDISKLEKLEYFYIGESNISSLSDRIFSLRLKEFDIGGNPKLSVKIINFPEPVEMCDLRDAKVICYQSNTCKTLVKSEIPTHELYPDAESVYENKCNDVAIDEKSITGNNKFTYIIISILFGIIILLCVVFYISKRKSKRKAKNELKADIVVSPLITVSPSELNNLKPGDRKSILALNRSSIMIGDRKSMIISDRNSIIIGDRNILPNLKHFNEQAKDVNIDIPEKTNFSKDSIKVEPFTPFADPQELKQKKTNSFENLTNLITNEKDLPVSSPSTSSKTISPSPSTHSYKVLPSPTTSVKLSTSPSTTTVKLLPSNSQKSSNLSQSNSQKSTDILPSNSQSSSYLSPSNSQRSTVISPSNSQSSSYLSPSNSQSSYRHSVIPLDLKQNDKALEAQQNSLEGSNIEPPPPSYSNPDDLYDRSKSSSVSSKTLLLNHSTYPLPSGHGKEKMVEDSEINNECTSPVINADESLHSTIPLDHKSNAKALEAQQNSHESSNIEPPPSYSNPSDVIYNQTRSSSEKSKTSLSHSTYPLPSSHGKEKMLEDSEVINECTSPVINAQDSLHSTIPLDHKSNAKALEAQQNSLEGSNIEPPPSYSNPSDVYNQTRSLSEKSKTFLSHSTYPLPSSHGKEKMLEDSEVNNECTSPVINAQDSLHSTIPLDHKSNAKALEAHQNSLNNSNTKTPPLPSYSNPSDVYNQTMSSSSVSSKTSLGHSTCPLPSNRGKEQAIEDNVDINNNNNTNPVYLTNDDRSPIGVIKKTYTLPPYSALPFGDSSFEEEGESTSNNKNK